ncbi:MAG: LemA family protein [Bacteroidetes bacterium]|nr:LemA family protein [Bacteroidota bacterium]
MQPEIIIPLLFFCVFLFAWTTGTYNKFVKYRNRIEESWSSIDVALKRRSNLIPNLVEAIKGYGKHESDIFESKINTMKGGNNIDSRVENESKITHSLSNLLAVAEAYPDLKASVNFLELQKNLAEIEEDIQTARIRYNDIVARLNTLIESFPASLIANKFGFEKKDYFSLDLATQRELPQINFS